uniref:Ras-associating domain-containing protein n=1 Tax=Oreochromis aureus TaxID=47969 RepID=A0A668USG8_OREAU
MEVKVFVDGIPRVVCGVTRETTCQEVVLVLAQALGQPGRYTLREKFKDFERCMTPEERLLETLERYGEQEEGEKKQEDLKRPKRKNRISLDFSLTVDKDNSALKSQLDHQTSCCIGNQTRGKESKHSKKTNEAKSNLCGSTATRAEEEKNTLRETIICQLKSLQDLQAQITCIDRQIFDLEERQRARITEQEAQERIVEEEMEQIRFWENELQSEEGYEKDLQYQFLEMRAKAVECKAKLEEYKCKMQRLDLFRGAAQEDSETASKLDSNCASEIPAVLAQDVNLVQSSADGSVNVNRKFLPREDASHPHALVHPNQIKERRPTGPTELREWWTRWSEAHRSQSQTQKVIHRSELTIYLSSTKV